MNGPIVSIFHSVNDTILQSGSLDVTLQPAKPMSGPADVILEPQDFDVKFDRSADASVDRRALSKNVLGCVTSDHSFDDPQGHSCLLLFTI